MTLTLQPRTRPELAQRLAQDIPEGWCVNLGVGFPTMVAAYVPPQREVIFHSENGVLGIGPPPSPEQLDPWLINAGKQPITLRTGGSFVHHGDSFAIIRGGHLDLAVLGAYEVAENGDLANWTTGAEGAIPAVGGAMDLSVGAKRVWILMDHLTKTGRKKLVRSCSYPLTALGAVDRIYTDLAILDVTPRGFEVAEMIPGLTLEELQDRTEATLYLPDNKEN
jgi:3-oxoadipate CoA-transferase beta subunit